MGFSTHVLDTSLGRPAAGVPLSLSYEGESGLVPIGRGVTDADGRVRDLVAKDAFRAGTYRLVFDTGTYFRGRGVSGFYPTVEIRFEVRQADEHYHVPLLLSPFGYSTYRGS